MASVNNLNATISTNIRRPIYNRVPSPAPSSVSTDTTIKDNFQNDSHIRQVI